MSVRFMQKGTTRIWFVPTIASPTGIPTVAEIGAGSEITKDIAEISGFMFSNDPIDTPDLESTFTTSIPGEDKSDASSLTYYDRKLLANNPAKTLMPKGTVGNIVIMPYGTAGSSPAIADETDTWPVQVASVSRSYSAGNEASKYTISFTPTERPTLDAAITA